MPSQNPESSDIDAHADNRPTHALITLRVPATYHQEPIITHLVADHGLVVNITAAVLGENPNEEGWFNLELRGTPDQIRSGLVYLEELDLEFWERADKDEETW